MRDIQDGLPILVERPKRKRPKPLPKMVVYVRIRCPECHSDRAPVQHTDPIVNKLRIRHHRCGTCGHTFKSVEDLHNVL